jgi:tetratricopeptide (TPR) repeat protein
MVLFEPMRQNQNENSKTDNPEKYFKQAFEAGKKKDYEKAISILKYVVNNFDNVPKALLFLGRSYHATGRFDQAIRAYEFFLKIEPESSPGYFFLGRTYLAMGVYDRAILNFKATIEGNPRFAPAYTLLGLALLKAKKPELAVAYLEEALKYAPQSKRIYNGYLNALLVKAIKFFQKEIYEESAQMFDFILKNKGESLLPHLYLGRINRILGNNREAFVHYDIASQMVPEDPLLKLQKAVTLLRLGEIERASNEVKNMSDLMKLGAAVIRNPDALLKYITLTLFSKKQYRQAIYYGKEILKANYNDIEIHGIIAESYLKLGDYNKSKNHYLRCIEGGKNKVEYYYGLFYVLWERKEYDEILQKVNRLKKINPDDKIADYFYMLSLAHTGAPAESVIAGLQNLIRSLGPDPILMQTLGEAYLDNDMAELAENWFLRTLKVLPENKDSLLSMIQVYALLAKPKKEKQYFEMYLKKYPSDNPMRKEYTKLLIRLGQFTNAITELDHIIPLEKNNLYLKKILAHTYMKVKRFEEAIPVLKELLRVNPQSMDHLKSLIFCLEKSGTRSTAIRFIERAREVFKDKESLSLMLGVLYFKEGLNEKSVTLFRDVIAKQPKSWKAYQNLGIVYKKIGNDLFGDKFLKRAEEYRQLAEKPKRKKS